MKICLKVFLTSSKRSKIPSLKDLGKGEREKLINKVMGIDDFDSAAELIKSDVKQNKIKLDSLDKIISFLKKSHEKYLENLESIKSLEVEIKENNSKIENLKKIDSSLKSKLDEYELKKNYQQTKKTLNAQQSEEISVSSHLKKFQDDQESLKKYSDVISHVEPKYKQLKTFEERFEDLEKELNSQQDFSQDIKENIPNSLDQISGNLKNRTSSLKKGIGFLISGVFVAILGILSPYLIIGGVILVIVGSIYLNQYRKLERKNLIENVKNSEKLERKKLFEKTILTLKNNISELRSESNFESSGVVKFELEKLNSTLKDKTGLETVEKLQGAILNLESLNKETKISELIEKIKMIKSKNDELENELVELERQKPPNLDLNSNLDVDSDIVSKYEDNRQKLEQQNKSLNKTTGVLQQLKKENSSLSIEYEQYPNELANKTKVDDENKLLSFLQDRFKEISAKMRNQVIPFATSLISEWLPQITNNRYTALEISEDLKFKVFEDAAGGYKERELFSGGTQDQFLIALRLAFTKSILDNRTRVDEYSLFMDEATSSSDYIRKEGIFDLLDEVKKTFKQIFIIAHEDISNSMDHHLSLERGSDGFTVIKSESW